MTTKPQIALSALSFEVDALTTEAHILPAVDFVPDDGRKMGAFASFKMSASIAEKIIARLSSKKNDTLIDYEHQSLLASFNGQPVPAAGWFNTLEYRPAQGLVATNITWTDQAKQFLSAKQYRYTSAVFTYDQDTGEVIEIISFALTNTPALDGLQALAGLSIQHLHQDHNPNQGDKNMSEKEIAALTTERDALKQQQASLSAEVTKLTADLAVAQSALKVLEDEKKQAALTAEKKAHTDLLQTALNDGRVAPAQKAWAEKLTLAALSEYLEASAPLADKQRQSQKQDDNGQLTDAEIAMCSRMGVKQEDFIASKKALASRKAS